MSEMIGANVSQVINVDALTVGIYKAAAATTKVRLYKNNNNPTAQSILGDFTEADFDGYAPFTIDSWAAGGALDPLTGLPIIKSAIGPASFTQTGVVITNTIYGMMIEVGGVLLLAEKFNSPVEMDTVSKQIQLFPRIFVQNQAGPGSYED